jgi:hypothetical protein
MADRLALRASEHLEALCVAITDRSVGSAGNQASTAWFEGVMRELGWRTERQDFTCLDWEGRGASLRSGGLPPSRPLGQESLDAVVRGTSRRPGRQRTSSSPGRIVSPLREPSTAST